MEVCYNVVAMNRREMLDRYFAGEGFYGYGAAKLCDSYKKQVLEPLVKSMECGSRILDVGAGTGEVGRYMEERGIPTVNMEVSFIALKNYIKGDKVCELGEDRWPFADQAFEMVHIKDTIGHIKDRKNIFKEANRVLKPMGELVIVSQTVDEWWPFFPMVNGYEGLTEVVLGPFNSYEKMIKMYESDGIIGPVYYPTHKEDLMKWGRKTGFEVMECTSWKPASNEHDWHKENMERFVLELVKKENV
jgi:ubiquinone/menaquinone biosynthesis C-methylase UbiE